MVERKPDRTRGNVAFAFMVILGLVIGIFIRRVSVGLVIGIAIGLLATTSLKKR